MTDRNPPQRSPERYWQGYYEALAADAGVDDHARVGYVSAESAGAMHALVSALLGSPAGRRILDAGSGDGQVTAHLAAANEVIALDLSPSMLARAAGRGLQPLQAGLGSLPLADASVDVVVCVEVITLTSEPLQTLDEFCRVLRPGGELVVTGQNAASWLRRLLTPLFARYTGKPQPRLLDADRLAGHLRRQGMDVSPLCWMFAGLPGVYRGDRGLSGWGYRRFGTNFVLHARRGAKTT